MFYFVSFVYFAVPFHNRALHFEAVVHQEVPFFGNFL